MTTTETLSVPEISCDHCKASIEGALTPLGGVTAATVDVATKTVTVTWDAPTDRASVVSAITDVGFDVVP